MSEPIYSAGKTKEDTGKCVMEGDPKFSAMNSPLSEEIEYLRESLDDFSQRGLYCFGYLDGDEKDFEEFIEKFP